MVWSSTTHGFRIHPTPWRSTTFQHTITGIWSHCPFLGGLQNEEMPAARTEQGHHGVPRGYLDPRVYTDLDSLRTIVDGDNVVTQIEGRFGQEIPRRETIWVARRTISQGESMILGGRGHICHPGGNIHLVNVPMVHT